jgi:hypothetical protein
MDRAYHLRNLEKYDVTKRTYPTWAIYLNDLGSPKLYLSEAGTKRWDRVKTSHSASDRCGVEGL